jgi:hypothetical protein
MRLTSEVWGRYGYLLASGVIDSAPGCSTRICYSGISRAEVWPVVDQVYWSHPERLPSDIKYAYSEIRKDPVDFLSLHVTRSAQVLRRLASFIEEHCGAFEILAVEVDSDRSLPRCDNLDVMWYGFEPYARGEWGLLSALAASEALASWYRRVNDHGLLSSPGDCLVFAAEYRKAMGRSGGPEPIADDAVVDVLRVGLVPSIEAA